MKKLVQILQFFIAKLVIFKASFEKFGMNFSIILAKISGGVFRNVRAFRNVHAVSTTGDLTLLPPLRLWHCSGHPQWVAVYLVKNAYDAGVLVLAEMSRLWCRIVQQLFQQWCRTVLKS